MDPFHKRLARLALETAGSYGFALAGGCSWPQPRRPDRGRDFRPHPAALGIENLEHRLRDTVWREGDQQARHGNGPGAMATLRKLALGLFAIHGITKSNKPSSRSAVTQSTPSH